MSLERLQEEISELRLEVTRHPLFFRSWSVETLRAVMEHHVVAVWDFMSLAKTLQSGLTHCDVPWIPPADPVCARMINEIILAEESDRIESLGFTGSHFELYLAAMDEVGANTVPMERFLAALAMGTPLVLALEGSLLSAASQRFARHTLLMAQKPLHEVAASFLFGREDVIPDMFRRMLSQLPADGCGHFKAYLERHIHMDADQHGPMARQVLMNLCGSSERRWQDAADAAMLSLAARRRLWDDIVTALDASAVDVHMDAHAVPGELFADLGSRTSVQV